MQIVIDIPEENYNNLKRKDKFDDMFLNYYEKLIVHSTPLPKGHGDLVDVDVLKEAEQTYSCDYEPDGFSHVVEIKDINDAPVIIKADKESEVDE